MDLNQIVCLETAKKLNAAGLKNESPQFGDIFYTIHPDTKQVDTVIVGSAKWNISDRLERYFAPRATDLLISMGCKYRICCINRITWMVEKEIDTTFEDPKYDYVAESYPVGNGSNPAEVLAEEFLKINNAHQ